MIAGRTYVKDSVEITVDARPGMAVSSASYQAGDRTVTVMGRHPAADPELAAAAIGRSLLSDGYAEVRP